MFRIINKFSRVAGYKINIQMSNISLYTCNEQSINDINSIDNIKKNTINLTKYKTYSTMKNKKKLEKEHAPDS